MVSTRAVKVKFSEGERVLCYEPDPSKTKVLYDSKVLEVICNKDGKGRKQVEYLIHFQGWNASWDRCVTEELVLKDTSENRELQRDLADNAHIKLSIKSNRVLVGQIQGKDKRLSQSSDGERDVKRKCQAGSDTSSQDGQVNDETNSVMSDLDGSTTQVSKDDDSSDDESYTKHVPLHIPDALKAVLERDFHLVNEKNKLVNLPAKRTVLSILDDYVRYFAMRYIARSKEKRRAELKEKEKAFMTLDLCKEIVDSLRVCFDYHISTVLLYNKELYQAEKLKDMEPLHTDCISGIGESLLTDACNDASINGHDKNEKDKVEPQPKRQLRSKRLFTEETPPLEVKDMKNSAQSSVTCESGRSTPTTLTSGASVTATPSEIREGLMTPLHSESLLHQQLKDWTLLPENQRTPAPPVMKYGAPHLLRLFVKLPQILYRMSLQPEKKTYIIKHLELFLEYLNSQNQEFFSDGNYIANPDS